MTFEELRELNEWALKSGVSRDELVREALRLMKALEAKAALSLHSGATCPICSTERGELERLEADVSKEQMDEWRAARTYEEKAARARTLNLPRIASILTDISRDETRHYRLLDEALISIGAIKPRE